MEKMIFVNLPVSDLPRSIAFYEAVGATKDPRFCDETCAMMSFSGQIHAMIMTHARFNGFTSRKIVDAHTSAQVLLCLSAESRDAVDATIARAVAAGAVGDPDPKEDHGWMYGRSFADPDGHIWEFSWMDVEAAMAAQGASSAA